MGYAACPATISRSRYANPQSLYQIDSAMERRLCGLVLSIAAAGNSGTVLANLAAPWLAKLIGWPGVLGLAMIPLGLTLIAFILLARDAPTRPRRRSMADYRALLRTADLWWYCLFYGVTFGGYVGLSGFLPLFMHDQYGASAVTAGYITALAAVVGSGVRPAGGWLADRFGGALLLSVLLVGIVLAYVALGILPPLPIAVAVLVCAMACLGMGNGAVFQLVPQTFGDEIGMATGVVGALGGLGGFVLPLLLGAMKQVTGSFAVGFAALGITSLVAFVALQTRATVDREVRDNRNVLSANT